MNILKRRKNIISVLSLMLIIAGVIFISCKKKDSGKVSVIEHKDAIKTIIPATSITKTVVFNSGSDGINSYRIPSLVTTKNGSLLLFCEARKTAWRDKSPTDLAVKRSTDNGVTWSAMKILTQGGNNAFMDPCAVVDQVTGKIFLFATLWPSNDHSALTNTAWLITSEDDGVTWSAPKNVTNEVVAPNFYISGFGPGSGFQMTKSTVYKNRLIVPIRLTEGTRTRNRALYSDDHGVTWKIGQEAADGGEFQIAESPTNTLINNRRGDGKRYKAKSTDGGVTWGAVSEDVQLITVAGGCQGSVLGEDNILFYTGPAGGVTTETSDNRSNFRIYRSNNGGDTWTKQYLLYDKAAGYSCITKLKDGRLAIVFETADSQGFLRISGNRPAGWMRLDVIVLPKEVLLKDHWFTK